MALDEHELDRRFIRWVRLATPVELMRVIFLPKQQAWRCKVCQRQLHKMDLTIEQLAAATRIAAKETHGE